MKYLVKIALVALQLAPVWVAAVSSEQGQVVLGESVASPDKYLIETQPGSVQWVTEEEKWELRRSGINFMDITETQDLGVSLNAAVIHADKVSFPGGPKFEDELKPLAEKLSKSKMRKNLEKFSSFHTRYYKSEYGKQSSDWLFNRVNQTIVKAAGSDTNITVEKFAHSWAQSSVIAKIPGHSKNTIVIGAHQDSINLFLPSLLAAPGADDDGSGTVTILEALRALLSSEHIRSGQAENTIEFHWYSAEEGGLLGSQAIFQKYEQQGRKVKAMLHQDMTGFVKGTLDAGRKESLGVVTDYVDPGLTEFIKTVIDTYCDIPYVDTKCGYACSDHASASKAGYPSAFVIESEFRYSDKHIHSTDDLIKYLSFGHMLQHAKLTLSFVYELARTSF